MSDVPDRWGFLQAAWRFASVLTGGPQGAAKVFQESVQEILRHPDLANPERTMLLFYSILRRRALKYPAACEHKGLTANLHKLNEPGRSALTLIYLDAMPAERIQRLLHLTERQLADNLGDARTALRQQTEATPAP